MKSLALAMSFRQPAKQQQLLIMRIGGVALVCIGKMIQSEAVQRALYFWVHAGPIVAHYKFAKWWLTKTKAPLQKRDRVYQRLHNQYAGKSFDIALKLKGLYVKIAQIVSSRPDFVPPQYVALFVTAQDSLPQLPIEQVVEIVDRTLRAEHNLSFDDVFESMDAVALGSASIGQCHRAVLKEPYTTLNGYRGGKTAAVKVMHPGAEERFRCDFQVFRWLCKVALTGWQPILDECYRQIMSEFDYRKEAASLERVRTIMNQSPFRGKVKVPEPQQSLCTKELLVMEMLNGKKLSDSMEDDLAVALGRNKELAEDLINQKRLEMILGEDKMATLGISGQDDTWKTLGAIRKLKLLRLYLRVQAVIDLLADVQGYQIFHATVFNGDPHPGNILKLEDGSLGLIDYGQTKSITEEEKLGVSRVVQAIGNHAPIRVIANTMRDLGFRTKKDNDDVLAKYAALFFDSDTEGKRIGCPTPQSYFKKLTEMDPLVDVPDVAIFVARSSFILRGMGTMLGKQVHTSMRWKVYAEKAIQESKKKNSNLTVR
ncbi:ABC1 family-domain containing protein [Nitzschia inconspicua]|uniref:ABC1 family-domain containing protein n=1 Tax=Nitzschia inconspicua TaxID=303405 RepID=A0A9K3PTF6_9STRA|nr:ABC1 family-domain containing protein [Nitzschia inconspicua]